VPGNLGRITGAPALIQSDQGSFEVFVPHSNVILQFSYPQKLLRGAQGKLTNVFRLSSETSRAVALAATQSSIGKLALVARVASSLNQNGDTLVAFEFDPLYITGPFTPTSLLPMLADGAPIDAVTGNPSLLYSVEQNAFELLVPRQRNGQKGLDYYVLEGETIEQGVWKFVSTLPQADAAPVAVSLMRSFTPGNLEAVARVSPGQGGNDFLVRYTFTSGQGWGTPSVVSSNGVPIIVEDVPVQ
jgi:hypothetical protein